VIGKKISVSILSKINYPPRPWSYELATNNLFFLSFLAIAKDGIDLRHSFKLSLGFTWKVQLSSDKAFAEKYRNTKCFCLILHELKQEIKP